MNSLFIHYLLDGDTQIILCNCITYNNFIRKSGLQLATLKNMQQDPTMPTVEMNAITHVCNTIKQNVFWMY